MDEYLIKLKSHYGIEDNKIIDIRFYIDAVVVDYFNIRHKVDGGVFSKWYFKKLNSNFDLTHGFCEIEFYWQGNMLK